MTENNMRKVLIALVSAACLSVGGAGSASAQTAAEMNKRLDTLFGKHAPYQKFFAELKKAVGADKKKAVASMVAYPFQAHVKGKTKKIKNAKQFVADYDRIVTPKVKKAVAKQTYAKLLANAQGVAIGDGTIWFSGVGKRGPVKIIAINH